jgi:DNA invertase Pin-like site-specific DNA recombinase
MIVGYYRSSTEEQEAGFQAQRRKLEEAGVEKFFGEQVSSVQERAQLEAALDFVREGDTFIVTAASRLARNTIQMLEIAECLGKKGVTLKILDLGVDTSNPTGKFILTVIAGVATWEREIMLERQKEGIAKARAEKKYKGRRPTAMMRAQEVKALKAQGFNRTEIAAKTGVSRASITRILRLP